MAHPSETDKSRLPWLAIAVIVLAVAAWFGWRQFQRAPAPMPDTGPTVSAVPAVPEPATAPLPADAPPAIQHPVEPPEPTAQPAPPLPALADSDTFVGDRLAALIGRPQVLQFLQLDGFVRRTVATVDNLGRDHAPAMMWPVVPTPGRFSVAQAAAGGTQTIHPDNALRYEAFVRLAETVDVAQAAALYRALYPLFQQAYEELGFPGRYFNDRLVQVMDLLIATPVPAAPPAVTLVQVKGQVPSTRPWVRYEYADPALEALPAGQKVLIRMGEDRQRRLQERLRAFRAAIARR